MDFLKDNSVWITPLLVAIVGGVISGIFYLIKKKVKKVISRLLKMFRIAL